MTDDIYDDGTPKGPGKPASTTATKPPTDGTDRQDDTANDTDGAASDIQATGAEDSGGIDVPVSPPPRAGDDTHALDFDDVEQADPAHPAYATDSTDASDSTDGPELPVLPDELPVLPVRDVVVFNYMILPLFVGREKSVQAVDAALNGSRYLMICTQRDESVDDPGPEDLHATGTVVMIMRMLKMPDNRLKVLVQGISRAKVESFGVGDGYLTARVETLPEPELGPPTVEQEAMMRAAR